MKSDINVNVKVEIPGLFDLIEVAKRIVAHGETITMPTTANVAESKHQVQPAVTSKNTGTRESEQTPASPTAAAAEVSSPKEAAATSAAAQSDGAAPIHAAHPGIRHRVLHQLFSRHLQECGDRENRVL